MFFGVPSCSFSFLVLSCDLFAVCLFCLCYSLVFLMLSYVFQCFSLVVFYCSLVCLCFSVVVRCFSLVVFVCIFSVFFSFPLFVFNCLLCFCNVFVYL